VAEPKENLIDRPVLLANRKGTSRKIQRRHKPKGTEKAQAERYRETSRAATGAGITWTGIYQGRFRRMGP
jgi:hypothetical protein